MKKIILSLFAIVLSISVANAWAVNSEVAVVMVAVQNLNPKTQKLVKKYLGKSFEDDIRYLYSKEVMQREGCSREIHYLHLDGNMRPMDVGENDAYVAIEKAVKVLNSYKSQPKHEVVRALRMLICLMNDIHHVKNVRIESIPYSQHDFTYRYRAAEIGKSKDKIASAKWSKLGSDYGDYPRGFSAEYRAKDMTIYLGDRFAEYSKGSLVDWIADNGAIAAYHLERLNPNDVAPHMNMRVMGDVHYESMIKSSCRLAALLNATLK